MTPISFLRGDVITKDIKETPCCHTELYQFQYFSKPQISYIKIDSEFLSKKYEVILTEPRGLQQERQLDGNELKKGKSRPAVLIPVSIKDYVKANFPNEIITKIERGGTGIEVELANDFSLKFNKKGQFVSMDD